MARRRDTCPGCNGEKTAGSRLCADCRRRAVSIGVQAVLDAAARGHGPAIERLTPGQRRAFYAKCNRLDRILERPDGIAKERALANASEHFSRTIESVNDLSENEAGWILDQLTTQIAAEEAALVG